MTVLVNPSDLNDMMQSMVDIGCLCLEDSPDGVPKYCFISHNEPPDDCCDFLAVWLERIRPRTGFENAAYTTGEKVWSRCGDVGAVMDVRLRLMRDCWPVVQDDALNPFPPVADMQAAADNLLIDLQLLRCCLSAAACNGVLYPENFECLEFGIGDAIPIGPRGGCAGWDLTYTFELEACTYGPDPEPVPIDA